ncbi:MAG: phenylalanine--tRNA ligase subunit beta [bacterium]|nr:phenylalanine--tRNA ligase subunit beta [bacterium]
MLLSFKWLSEFIKLPSKITVDEVANALTMAGIEVEGFKQITELDDCILDVQVTPNRSDALSHIGIARELAAIFDCRFHMPNNNVKELGIHTHDMVHVKVEAKEACPRYACRIIEGVKIEESPVDLQIRLLALGIRPVNNVVDITNLILLERGQPLHAFDWDKLKKSRGKVDIHVRYAHKGEKLVTLDDKDRNLTADDLVVADSSTPVALAGVMGGKGSEVTDETTTILLESAYFMPDVVRAMSKRHSLSTESSYRFERGCDPGMVVQALDCATEMICKHAGGRVCREVVDIYPLPIKPLEIFMRKQKLSDISGLLPIDLDEAKIRSKFLALGIETIERHDDSLRFRVPTFRPDLTREIDLIEEAMRLIGFDKVPLRLSYEGRISSSFSISSQLKLRSKIDQSLLASGFSQALNYSFGSPQVYALFQSAEDPELIRVKNPLGEDLSVLRQSLLPGLIENLVLNIRRGNSDVKLFETGTVFKGTNPAGKVPNVTLLHGAANQDAWANEELLVSAISYGAVGNRSFDTKPKAADFFDLKGVLEKLLSSLKIPLDATIGSAKFSALDPASVFLHPGEAAQITVSSVVNGETKTAVLGIMGKLHPDIQTYFALDKSVYVFELNVAKLLLWAKEDVSFKALPKFPSVTRDLAFVLDETVAAGDLQDHILNDEAIKPYVSQFRIFDLYQGSNIEKGKKSVAVSLTLSPFERTFTDEEIGEIINPMLKRLKADLGAVIR